MDTEIQLEKRRNEVDFSVFENSWYKPGGNILKRLLWFYVNAFVFRTSWLPFSGPKNALLRLFGAKVGKGVVIKPSVNIKHPWRLEIGDHCWIGEDTWIDNLADIRLGKSVCLSQGAMLLTGSHDYKRTTFDLTIGEIVLEDGVWIGAKTVVCPGVTCATHSVLAVGSIATKDLEAYGIYQGNPAVFKRERKIG
ncbi:colanic acid biosynthesis acetyltransferase WcaF [Fulvitalea axinellae]|uniref:Colanic acid biosynthesis acetyltransferase WcaF n=2 Tax=Fulvitalea axinellae TaxID=1182444 RepID=A0AAU9D688_9BACT|nr:colanic acid biosynthesis acetyltransferase WcaF [Fulvitalea axinellae]